MPKTGTKQNKKMAAAYSRLVELESISENFALSMRTADERYIARTGVMTPRMQYIWAQYVEHCRGIL